MKKIVYHKGAKIQRKTLGRGTVMLSIYTGVLSKEPLNNAFMVAPMPFRDGMQGAKRKAWSFHA